jgi:hypothetical protein
MQKSYSSQENILVAEFVIILPYWGVEETVGGGCCIHILLKGRKDIDGGIQGAMCVVAARNGKWEGDRNRSMTHGMLLNQIRVNCFVKCEGRVSVPRRILESS